VTSVAVKIMVPSLCMVFSLLVLSVIAC